MVSAEGPAACSLGPADRAAAAMGIRAAEQIYDESWILAPVQRQSVYYLLLLLSARGGHCSLLWILETMADSFA
ncbi:hypothetical protein D3C84_1143820 [compost metagenome]